MKQVLYKQSFLILVRGMWNLPEWQAKGSCNRRASECIQTYRITCLLSSEIYC